MKSAIWNSLYGKSYAGMAYFPANKDYAVFVFAEFDGINTQWQYVPAYQVEVF